MPRFSLSQALVAIMALAIGLAIARLPEGTWLDVPLATLSFYFALSLARHSRHTLRLLKYHPELPREQRWGGRLLAGGTAALALSLVASVAFTAGTAVKLILVYPEIFFLDYLSHPTLSRSLTILVLLCSVAINCSPAPRKPLTIRRIAIGTLAGAALVVLLFQIWTDNMLIPYLVYVAINSVEASMTSPAGPPIPFVHQAVLQHRLARAAALGGWLLMANLLSLCGLVRWWPHPRVRRLLVIALLLGVGAAGWLTVRMLAPAFRDLSPTMYGSMAISPPSAAIAAGLLVAVAVGMLAWRLTALPAPIGQSSLSARPRFLEETWWAAALVGLMGVAGIANDSVRNVIAQFTPSTFSAPFSLRDFLYELTFAAQFLWFAAAIGGFTLAWQRWRRRDEPLTGNLPCVDPVQFAVVALAIVMIALAAAPIVAALSFSYWFSLD